MKALLKTVYLNLRGISLNALGLFFPCRPALSSPSKILFIRIDRIGDMVLSTPALTAIKNKYPGAELSVLAAPVTAPLLAADPRVARVIVWEGGWSGKLAVIRRLRTAKFDIAIDSSFDYPLKTAILAYLSGAGVRVGYDLYGRGVFFNIRVVPGPRKKHFVEETCEVLKPLGIAGPCPEPELFISAAATARAEVILKDAGLAQDELLVAVHPGGHYPSQRWLPERFAEVISLLIDKHGARILLIGAGPERAIVDYIALTASGGARGENIFKVLDQDADVLCALIGRARIFIGNNSGPLHIAGALKIPAVSTMGPTDPVRWHPRGPVQIVIKTGRSCGPCGKGLCETHECMRDITVGMVMESAERLLAGQARGRP